MKGFALAALLAAVPALAQVDVDAFLRKDRIDAIKLSPTGAYYAATIPLGGRTTGDHAAQG